MYPWIVAVFADADPFQLLAVSTSSHQSALLAADVDVALVAAVNACAPAFQP